MRKATRNKLALAGVLTGAVVTAAACQDMTGDSSATKPKHHATACVKVVNKAHVEGTRRWYLSLKRHHDPVLVTHKTYQKYGIGECFPTKEI